MSSSSKGKSVVRTAPPLRFPKSIGSPVPFLADPLVGHNTVDYHPGANIYTPQMLLQTTAMIGDAMYKLLLIDVVKSKTEDQITALDDYLSNAFQRQFLELIGLDVSSANDHHAGTLFEYHFAGNHHFRWKFVEIQFPNYFRLAWERAGGEGNPNINVVIGEAYQALNTNE